MEKMLYTHMHAQLVVAISLLFLYVLSMCVLLERISIDVLFSCAFAFITCRTSWP